MGKFLVTGCAGFIGSVVCQQLLADGCCVEGVDCFTDAYDVRLKDWRVDQLRAHPNFSFTMGNINYRPWLRDFFARRESNLQPTFDAVLNLATRAGVRASLKTPWKFADTNLCGTLNLLELCREHKVPKFVLGSTSSVNRDVEPYDSRPAGHGARLVSPDAGAKKPCECMAFSYHQLYGLDVSVLRYANVYGPAGRPDMAVFNLIESMLRNETLSDVGGRLVQTLPMTFVDDVASGTIAALRPMGHEIVNLAGGATKLTHVIETLQQQLERHAQIDLPAFAKSPHADYSNAGQLLDWRPETSLQDGLAQTVAWHFQHRDLLNSIRRAYSTQRRAA